MKINHSIAFQPRVDEDISTAFRNVFSVLEPEEESFLLKSSSQHLYDAGEVIVRQNRPFSGIYVIVKGEVRVELDFEGANDCGAPVELARLRRGDIFGKYHSSIMNQPAPA